MARNPDRQDELRAYRNAQIQVTKSRISKAHRNALASSARPTTRNDSKPPTRDENIKETASTSTSERATEYFVAKQKLITSRPLMSSSSERPSIAEVRANTKPMANRRQSAIEQPVVKKQQSEQKEISDPVENVRTSLTAVSDANIKNKVSVRDFKGVIAPVFTCFKNDGPRSLEVRPIQRYADWLHSRNVIGVMVNGVVGEGPSMTVKERKANLEYWHTAVTKNNMLLIVQVGGAPLPDVQALAMHAEQLGVSAVVTLPEVFYRPRSVDQLVNYCQYVASHCPTRPFLYYHIPSMTGVDLDMVEFCTKAEKAIPNFVGLHYSGSNLEMGQKCLRPGRVVLLGSCAVLASGLMSGFTSINLAVVNIRPEMVLSIWDSFRNNEFGMARERQNELNRVVEIHTHASQMENWVITLKKWFNKELVSYYKGAIYAGPARTIF